MEQKILIFNILLIFFISSFSLYAQENIKGNAKVIDGDTIQIGKNKIRLHGIDAPEKNQKCIYLEKEWECGIKSTKNLIELIKLRKVNCFKIEKDKYKRTVAECYVNSISINKWMVKSGWAVAYKYYSKKYVEDEQFAKKNNLGIWVGTFEYPWEYRKKNK